MTRETKFGLLLVVTLTTVFGVLVYKKLHHPNALVAGTSNGDTPEGSTDVTSPTSLADAGPGGFPGPGSEVISPTPMAAVPTSPTPLGSSKVTDPLPTLTASPVNPSLQSAQRTTTVTTTRTASLDSGSSFSVVDAPAAETPRTSKPNLPTELGEDPFFSPMPAVKPAAPAAGASSEFDGPPAMAAKDTGDSFSPAPATNDRNIAGETSEDPFGPPAATPTSKVASSPEAGTFAPTPGSESPRAADLDPFAAPVKPTRKEASAVSESPAAVVGQAAATDDPFAEPVPATPSTSPAMTPKVEEDPFGSATVTTPVKPQDNPAKSQDLFTPALEEPAPPTSPNRAATQATAQPAGLPAEEVDPFMAAPAESPVKVKGPVPLPTMAPEEKTAGDIEKLPPRYQPTEPSPFDASAPTPVKAREPVRTPAPVTGDDPFADTAPKPAPSAVRATVIGESRPPKDKLNVNDQQLGGFRPVRVLEAEAGSTTVVQPSLTPTNAPPTERLSADPVEFPVALPQGSTYPGSTKSQEARATRMPMTSTGERADEYTVQQNDNFWTISKRVYGTGRYFQALAQHNAAVVPNPQRMRAGLVVATPPAEQLETLYASVIPVAAPVTDAPAAAETLARPAEQPGEAAGFYVDPRGQPFYRVGPKDTLSDIAKQHLGRASRWIQIYELNRETLKDGHNLKVGAVLKLPADASGVRMVGADRTSR